MQAKVFYTQKDGSIVQESYCLKGENLIGHRLFTTTNNYISDDGVYHSKQVPLEWVVEQQFKPDDAEVIYAVVQKSSMTDEEYDSLTTSHSGIVSPDSFGESIDDFREFMKSHGVPSTTINKMIDGWLSFQANAA